LIGEDLVLPLKGDKLDQPREEEPKSGPLRRFGAWLRAGGTWERPITGLQRELGLRMDDLVNFLGARPFFYSDRLSIADLGVYAMLFTMRRDAIPGSARLLAERPTLLAFLDRVEQATGGAPPPLRAPRRRSASRGSSTGSIPRSAFRSTTSTRLRCWWR